MGWAIILGLVAVAAIATSVIFKSKIYNDLVTRRNKVKNSWAHIETQLQRRFDLIPNLVDVVKGFAIHERQILDSVTASIGEYVNAQSSQEKLAANEQLTCLLKSLYNVTDNYPQLRSNANFLQLQSALTEIEEDLSYARQFYNDAVTIYNNQLMKFPNNIIAQKYGFKEEAYFTATQSKGTAPKIDLRYNTKKECPVCGAAVDSNDANCKYCGSSLV